MSSLIFDKSLALEAFACGVPFPMPFAEFWHEFSSEAVEANRYREIGKRAKRTMSLDFHATLTRSVRLESRLCKVLNPLAHVRADLECGLRNADNLLCPCRFIFHVCMVHNSAPLVKRKGVFLVYLIATV